MLALKLELVLVLALVDLDVDIDVNVMFSRVPKSSFRDCNGLTPLTVVKNFHGFPW